MRLDRCQWRKRRGYHCFCYWYREVEERVHSDDFLLESRGFNYRSKTYDSWLCALIRPHKRQLSLSLWCLPVCSRNSSEEVSGSSFWFLLDVQYTRWYYIRVTNWFSLIHLVCIILIRGIINHFWPRMILCGFEVIGWIIGFNGIQTLVFPEPWFLWKTWNYSHEIFLHLLAVKFFSILVWIAGFWFFFESPSSTS